MKYFCKIYLLIFIVLCQSTLLISQDRLNVLTLNNPSPGYLFFSDPITGNGIYSPYDNYGIPHIDSSISATNKFELPDLGDSAEFDRHDKFILPNNRYLIAMRITRVIDLSQIIDGGREDALVIGCLLLEIDEDGNIYWRWNSFDHISIQEATDDIDLTQQTIDYVHFNSVVIDKNGDLLVSFRHLDQIVKINKNTGSIVWSLGGSASKSNDFNFTNDDQNGFFGFSHQHSIHILPNDNILLFDNGNLKDPSFSRAVQYQLDLTNFVATKVWEYRHDPDIYLPSMGDLQRLSNGNILINWRSLITEVKPNGNIALEVTINFPIIRTIKIFSKMDYDYERITSNGVYQFNNQTDTTGIKLDLNSVTGYGTTWVEKHNYAPPSESFILEDYYSILPYRWVISSDSITAMTGKLIISTDVLDGNNDFNKLTIFKRNKEATGNFVPLTTSYNSASKELWANFSGLGEIMIVSFILSTPTLLSPLNTSNGIEINSTLRWNKLQGATSYLAQISSDNNFSNIVFNRLVTTDTIAGFSGLENDKQYYWRVCGINSKDTSEWSGVRSFYTELAKPILSHPANNSDKQLIKGELKWEKTDGANYYQVVLFMNAPEPDTIINELVYNNVLNYSLSPNSSYIWKVKVMNSSNNYSQWSDVYTFKTAETISVEEDKWMSTTSCSINPNPFIDKFTVDLSNNLNEKVLIQISNNLGITVFNETFINDDFLGTKLSIDFSRLPSGSYILKIVEGNKVFSKLILKIN